MLEARFPGHALSVSIGIAHSRHGYADIKRLVAAADNALYTAWPQGTAPDTDTIDDPPEGSPEASRG